MRKFAVLSIVLVPILCLTVSADNSNRRVTRSAQDEAQASDIDLATVEPIQFQIYLVKVNNIALDFSKTGFETLDKMTVLKLASYLSDPEQAEISTTSSATAFDGQKAHYEFTDRINVPILSKFRTQDGEKERIAFQWVEKSIGLNISEIKVQNDMIKFLFSYEANLGDVEENEVHGNLISETKFDFYQAVLMSVNSSKIINVSGTDKFSYYLVIKNSVGK